MALDNAYQIDGIDLWTYYGITLEKGSLDDFLKYARRKESITHNWKDEDGLDTDLSRVFLDAREISVNCFIIADNESDFWLHYNQFLTLLRKPGTRRFSVVVFNQDYNLYYKECNIYQKLTAFRNRAGEMKLFCRFRLTMVEQKPEFSNEPTYIIDEAGRFLIT